MSCRVICLELAGLVQLAKLLEKGGEQLGIGRHVLAAHCLPNRVHGEGGHPKVHSPDANPGRNNRPNCGATRTIVPHYELLQKTVNPVLTNSAPVLVPG